MTKEEAYKYVIDNRAIFSNDEEIKLFLMTNIIYQKAYVYYLQDKSFVSKECYIGQTIQEPRDRLYGHKKDALNIEQNKYNDNYKWIRSILNAGSKIEIIVLEEMNNVNLLELDEAEKWHVKRFIEMGIPITNGTRGGREYVAFPWTIAKMRETQLKEENLINNALKNGSLVYEQVKAIKYELYYTNDKYKVIAQKFNTTVGIVTEISNGSKWKSIKIYDDNGNELKLPKRRKNTKYTIEEEVVGIKKELAKGIKTMAQIARQFNVKPKVIHDIVTGKTWKTIKIYDENNNELMPIIKNGCKKLVEEQVIEIKKLLLDGKLTASKIAKIYGVARTTINDIKFNRCWTHIKI